jgi:hypothetical protein
VVFNTIYISVEEFLFNHYQEMEKVYIDIEQAQILYEPNENTVELDISREEIEGVSSAEIEKYINTKIQFLLDNQ